MSLSTSSLAHRLSLPVDAASLGLFRILWGLTMCLEARWVHGQLAQLHDPGSFHFAFPGFSWIRHFPSAWMMEIETAAMMVGAIGIALGICTRPAIALFLATFAHFFFTEAAAYNNHFYLIVLINFLLLFCNSDRCFSLRRWR
ncbi:MAG TPA: HTTM domain-containing protein, partial [Bacteroidia bacterium]|nr:HTTM domain-containing protein [Bacteroidia bacterium]